MCDMIKTEIKCEKNFVTYFLIRMVYFFKMKKIPDFIKGLTIMKIYIDGELSSKILISDCLLKNY